MIAEQHTAMFQEVAEDDDNYDAASVMFNRGDFMRRLREMEREDEQERASKNNEEVEHDDSASASSTLDYEAFLANQRYHDDYKHVNYRHIDFGFVGDRLLIIQQSREYGKGGLVWDAGFILGDHLIQTQKEWNPLGQPRRIVELGSGTGVSGLMLASAFPESKVYLTDLPQLMPLLEENAKEFENAAVGELEWGTSLPVDKYDVIVGSDVIAGIYDSSGLAKTIHDLATERSQVYLAVRERLSGNIEVFESHLRALFHQVERRPAQSRNRAAVWILYATGRKSHQ